MGIFGKTNKYGFSVIELLIAIAVIGILATIVMVSYGGYQARTRDNERKSDVQQVAGGLSAYLLQKDTYIESGSGCGLSGNGNGWLSAGPSELGALYPKSIVQCLQEAKVLAAGTFTDPSGCKNDSGGACGSYRGNPVTAYMKVTCTKGGNKITYVMAYLETVPRNNSVMDALCDSGSAAGFDATGQMWGTNYGMNYYVTAK